MSKLYKCDQCAKSFNKKSNLKRHLATHMDFDSRPKVSCHECDNIYFHQKTLNSHIKSNHMKLKPYTCQECKTSFPTRFQLSQHTRKHMNPNKREKFHCKECDKQYFTRYGLSAHVNAHHKRLRELTCSWPGCNGTAASPSNLRIHIESVHRKLYQYPCPANGNGEKCLKKFKHKGYADIHYRRVHLKERQPCPLASCQLTFQTHQQSRVHYRREHEGDTARWRCPHCRKLLANRFYLLNHIDAVHKKIRIKCELCDKSFKSSSGLVYHKNHAHKN